MKKQYNKKRIFICITIISILIITNFSINPTAKKTRVTLTKNNYLNQKSQNTNNYAVFIGCGSQWQIKSAEKIKEKINNGFWKETKIIKGSSATPENIQDSINWLYNKATNEECTLLFYYAGHSQKNALITSLNEKIYDIILMNWFSKFSMTDKLILIFETCFSGRLEIKNKENLFTQNLLSFSQKILNLVEKISQIINNQLFYYEKNETYDGVFINLVAPGRIVISASRQWQKAWQLDRNIGAFTYFLIKGLDETNYIETAFKSAKKSTRSYALQWEKQLQNPQIADRIIGNIEIKN